MDIVDLPSVAGGLLVVDALERARASHRSGVIVQPFEQPRVLTVDELSFFMEERNRRHQPANLPIEYVIPQRRALFAAHLHTASEFRHSGTARDVLEHMLKSQHAYFVILDATPLTGEVVTISESLAGPLRLGFKICRCTVDPSHVYASGSLIVPGRCNLDGKPVVCS
jgi:hypothetical protein